METLFENNDFILKSTGHNYDFVGIIETKGYKPLTFYFEEHEYETKVEETEFGTEYGLYIDESETKLLGVYKGLKEYNSETDDPDSDEEEIIGMDLGANSWFRTRDDRSTGFLAEPRDRGQFLALIKAYCPEKLDRIAWA